MMINNICDNNKSATTHAALKAPSANVVIANGTDADDVARVANGLMQTTYGNGIWYSEIVDKANKTNTKTYNVNNNNNNNNNNKTNIMNRNVWLSKRTDILKEQQQIQQQHTTTNHANNNECDIIIVDMENDDDIEEEETTHTTHTAQPKYYMDTNTNLKFCRKPPAPPPPPPATSENINININTQHIANMVGIGNCKTDVIHYDSKRNDNVNVNVEQVNNDNDVDGHNDDDDNDDDDSLASMETLSDNVSIWIDGEKHWVAGVDANTTCSDLIWALLNYQNGQQQQSTQQRQQIQQQQPNMFASSLPLQNKENIAATVINKTNSNQHEQPRFHLSNSQQQQQQQQPKLYDRHDVELNLRLAANQGDNSTLCNGNKHNHLNIITNTNNCNQPTSNTSTSNNIIATATTTTAINQSMPINTKENCKIISNSTPTVTDKTLSLISSPLPPTLLQLTLPAGMATVSQVATEYVIVKQYHHCEEYLDGSTKVFDVLPPRDGSHKKQCELLLRHLGPAPAIYINNTTPQLSSLISTDKDSGMGSPVGSARSAKFRRRKHKSSQWLAQANTLHPKLSRCTANERLMKIILAQDETIQRQLSLLREKERQITKIEEEKHRKRERELGKNYLLETYLNGLDEAECEPEVQHGEEIFVDEPYQRDTTTKTPATMQPTAIPGTAITPAITSAGVTLAAGMSVDAFNVLAKHKLKEKEAKKEKKKKRHKERPTKDEDFNGKTNKSRDKEKLDHQQHHELNETSKDTASSNEQDIEIQILWLEKIYSLNKQLQKEEELAAKLHAKVRKHQLRKAQQTQREVQMEIDKLDDNLALQCGDIRKVEANLMQTNEQLQRKLLILERLSIDYLEHQQHEHKHQPDSNELHTNEVPAKELKEENPLKNDANNILTSLEKSLDIQKLSLKNIQSKEEVKKLEKIIAKPAIDLQTEQEEVKQLVSAAATVADYNYSHNGNNAGSTSVSVKKSPLPAFNAPHNLRFSNEYTNRLNEIKANAMSGTSNLTNCNAIVAAAVDNQQQTHTKPQLITALTTGVIAATDDASNVYVVTNTTNVNSLAAATKTETLSTASSVFIDKNMLSSLHVQNAKTIKKQMFHTQTTQTTATMMATQQKIPALVPAPAPAPAQAALPVTARALSPAATALLTSAFPKQQFQNVIPQQHIPKTTSTYLTSRPQNSHQILPQQQQQQQQLPSSSNIIFLQHHTTNNSMATIATSLSTASSSSSSAPVSSTLIVSAPRATVSPSPSIMAMNTVDISQLGTLV
ncbi:hypothetical protein DOY81_006159 [Sarcophaga bullata]|nr:hypothetical protein DOY81_006159 [Sarcophaga bullata]